MGGTMRLGSYTAEVQGQVKEIYGRKEVSERHRHRYEVNNEYIEQLEDKGLKFSGMNKEKDLVEYIELPESDYYVGTQAHPEFTSRFADPNPLYVSFIENSMQ
jgi:CTP synthase